MRCLVESLFRVAGLEVVDQLLCALADSLADGALRVGRGKIFAKCCGRHAWRLENMATAHAGSTARPPSQSAKAAVETKAAAGGAARGCRAQYTQQNAASAFKASRVGVRLCCVQAVPDATHGQLVQAQRTAISCA